MALAKRLGCEIEVRRPRIGKLAMIHLPEGMQVMGNRGLDVLVHNVEADDNLWAYIYDDLCMLDGGMEPVVE
jgi:hypothetical protein